jgi:hypothetical protein
MGNIDEVINKMLMILNEIEKDKNIVIKVSHPALRANSGASQICDKIKSHAYDDSWYRNQCHNFII